MKSNTQLYNHCVNILVWVLWQCVCKPVVLFAAWEPLSKWSILFKYTISYRLPI